MSFSVRFTRIASALLSALLLTGCMESASSQLDEEKEPHFLAGKSRISSLDFNGAIEAFEKALEVNPRSAAAHFELAWLYEQKANDPAAAIYHYERYLRYQPKGSGSDMARQHIFSCKQALASTVSLGPITEKQQRDFEKMLDENKQLTGENKKLNDALAALRATVATSNAPAAASSRAETTARNAQSRTSGPTILIANVSPATGVSERASSNIGGSGRTHTIKPGETLAQIARRYNVKLEALMAANPQVDARRLRVGQTLSVPSQ